MNRGYFGLKFAVCALLIGNCGAGAQQPEPTKIPSADTVSASVPATPLPRSSLGEALELLRKGNYDAAISKYQKLLQQQPKSPDGYAGLVRCYLKKEDVELASATVTKALQETDAWPVHVALGEVYFRQGKINQAEKEWVNVINGQHPAARAYLGLARVRWAIEMNKTAKNFIDKAHEMDPDDPDIQGEWIETLPRSERISYYEKFLAESKDLGEKDRTDLLAYVASMKDRAEQPGHHCRLVSKVTSTQTPLVRLLLDATHLRGYGLAVQLNGTHTNIMLDTGASGILIKRSTAEKAGITKIAETKTSGIGDKGLKDAYVGAAKSIRIGELEFQDCPVEVMESRSVADEDGLIGADVFEDFLVEIDFPNEKLKLSELPRRPGEAVAQPSLNDQDDPDKQTAGEEKDATPDPGADKKAIATVGPQDRYIAPEMQSYTRVFRFGHYLLVPTQVSDVPGKLFMIDTGSMSNFISPAAAREVTKVYGDSDTYVSGISGNVKKVYSANKAVLVFGHLRQENQDMTSIDMTRISNGAGTEISGFFGFVMLRFLNIKIDYRDALVDFAYDPQRWGR